MSGKLICIEGIDASGKNTQSKLLAERLKAKVFSYPNYETPSGKAILEHLQSKWKCIGREMSDNLDEGTKEWMSEWDPMVLQSLYVINRLERDGEIRSLLKMGSHVVFDRYFVSGMVYGSIDGLDPVWVERLHSTMVQPDLNILIDVPVDESVKRRPERRDRYEANLEMMQRARDSYRFIFTSMAAFYSPQHKGPRWQVVDGVGSVDEVRERVFKTVADHYLGNLQEL